MEQDFFKDLPSEIISNILSRLPARTAMSCKCVCKPWLGLLATPEFVKSYLSKSVSGLAIFERKPNSKPYKMVEFVDDQLDLNCDERRWDIVCNLDFPFHKAAYTSADGLLFLCEPLFLSEKQRGVFLCNPMTRDSIMLPSPSSKPTFQTETYGFGVSRLSGQYKFVKIRSGGPMLNFECQVYTVGTGSRRSIACRQLRYENLMIGAFLNGNLHWLVSDRYYSRTIACLDLETEVFSTFSPPPLDEHHHSHKYKTLSVLGECLCICENLGYEIHIWLMKEYGDEQSWTKEFMIRKNVDMDDYIGWMRPIKDFKDGDMMMIWSVRDDPNQRINSKLLYYSNDTKTTQQLGF